MTNKMQFYAQMAEDAAKQITGSREQWTAFLRTAARLYKYPYHEQLMIFAQLRNMIFGMIPCAGMFGAVQRESP